jgi:hypothetical protein
MTWNDRVPGTVKFDEPLPPDLETIGASLDTLAAHDRAAAPAGLAGRIYRATLPLLRGDAEEPATYPIVRAGSPSRGLALAAALALLATVGAVWLAGVQRHASDRGAVALAPISETDLDAWLALAGVSESTDPSLDPLDQIAAAADALAQTVADGWTHDDLFNSDLSAEGSL